MSDEIHRILGNIEGKNDLIVSMLKSIDERQSALEKKQSKTETLISFAFGGFSVVATIMGMYVFEIKQAIAKIITHG